MFSVNNNWIGSNQPHGQLKQMETRSLEFYEKKRTKQLNRTKRVWRSHIAILLMSMCLTVCGRVAEALLPNNEGTLLLNH